jgi:hypothetical protein
MPTSTYKPLATVTLGSAASTVTFGSIPAIHRDLVLVFSGSATSNGSGASFRLNGDTGNNYGQVRALGIGSTISSAYSGGGNLAFLNSNEGLGIAISNVTLQIMDYSATNKHKTTLNRNNNNNTLGTHVEMIAGRWFNTAAVTSITISGSINFATGSTFSLYGIAA